MSLLSSIIYGVIQGIAEFLPISSSGHLALSQNFFGAEQEDQLAFNILLHLGTLLAVFIVYRKDVWLLFTGFFSLVKRLFTRSFKKPLEYGERLFLYICLASVPLVPAALLSDYVEKISSYSFAIGILLLINGGMLYISEKLSNGKERLENAKAKNIFYVGLFQLFGVLPGISRSGSTITGGLFNNFDRESAIKLSFLMSIPAILGAAVFELKDFGGGVSSNEWLIYLAGAATAAIVGIGAIKLLQFLAKNKSLLPFAVYSVIIGAAAIIGDIIV